MQPGNELPDLPTVSKARRSLAVGKQIFPISGEENATIERYDVEGGSVSRTCQPENYRYSFRACLYNGGKIIAAGLWTTDSTFLSTPSKEPLAAKVTCDRKAFILVNCHWRQHCIG